MPAACEAFAATVAAACDALTALAAAAAGACIIAAKIFAHRQSITALARTEANSPRTLTLTHAHTICSCL
jgi:hypothetical protein